MPVKPYLAERVKPPIWVDADDPIVSAHLILTGDWDNPLADILGRILEPEDVFLDLGAHVGYFSVIAAHKCRQVIAVEPQQELYSLILKNGRYLPNLWAWPVAVGLRRGWYDLYVPPNRGAASFNHQVGRKETVWCCELSDIAPKDVTVAKVDLEGDDPQVLAANPEFLAGLKTLIFEYQPNHFDGPAYFEQIRAAGFTIYKTDGTLITEPPDLPEGFYVNLIGFRVAE